MSYSSSSSAHIGRASTLVVLVALVVVVLAVAIFGPHASTVALWIFRATFFVFLPLFVIGALVLAWALTSKRWLFGTLTVLAIVGSVGWWVMHSYSVNKIYAATITVTDKAVPEYEQRTPFPIASAQVRSNLGGTGGDVSDTTFVLNDSYTSLINRRGAFSGYETLLTQTFPAQGGNSSATTCNFDAAADARASGWFGHKLERQLNKEKRFVRFRDEDLYGYCDGGTPMVVMPLIKQTGLLRVVSVPDGVALYNGKTGQITFADSAPGPSYPLSIAARQREASHAIGSFGQFFFKSAGYDSTSKDSDSSEDSADEDTNQANPTEFALSGSTPGYVTPLTGRGSATAISAISEVSTAGRKGLAPMTIHTLRPSWKSTDAIRKQITGDYQDLQNWTTLTIFEITPIDGNRWVATIGNDQNVLYRAVGNGTLNDSKEGAGDATCLYYASGELYRCGKKGAEQPAGSEPSTVPTGNLGSLTNEQLAQLQRQLADEVERRLSTPAS